MRRIRNELRVNLKSRRSTGAQAVPRHPTMMQCGEDVRGSLTRVDSALSALATYLPIPPLLGLCYSTIPVTLIF